MPSAPATKTDLAAWRPSAPVLGGFALAGLVLILYVHHWTLSASVIFLTFAWVGILGSGYYLWTAGLFVAAGDEGSEGFHQVRNRTEELMAEKHSLLKAIKEVEFDHMMNKMSDEDASALSQLYRRRAVEILKELDADPGADETLSIAEKIERDVRARAQIGSVTHKARQRALARVKKKAAAPEKVPAAEETDAEPDVSEEEE